MAKSKWRFSERLPFPIQATLLFISLVLILSTVSFQMLPKSTWDENLGSLLLGVSTYVSSLRNTTNTAIQENSATGGDLAKAPISVNNSYSQPPYDAFPLFKQSPSVAPTAQDVAIALPKDQQDVFDLKAPALAPLTLFIEDVLDLEAPASAPLSDSIEDVPSASATERVNTFASPSSSEDSTTTIDTSTVSVAQTPLVSSAPVSALTVDTGPEKFLVPILSAQVGAGNQFMEYVSAAVIARSLNRTLCLSPFFPGPSRHTGRVRSGLAWMDRYEESSLSRFTRVSTLERCLDECHYTLDNKWMLKSSREPVMENWKKYPRNKDSWNLNWDYVRWTSSEDIFASLGSRNERCVGMLGLFPGLRWRGAFLAVSAFLRPAPRIYKVADKLQEYALGKDTRYLAVHWRFEESECGPHNVGLCFVRCQDGSVIDTGLHPEAKEWHEAAEVQCDRDGHFRGVTLDKYDIVDAIQERAVNHSVNTIYFATDGWMRGSQGASLVKEVVVSLRKRGLTVVGLWKLSGLPNFQDGKYFDHIQTLGKKNQDLNGAQIALVEQELCSRAVSFMGSGQSTWSLSVFRVRLARRRVKQIVEAVELDGSVDLYDSEAVDELISRTLLKDEHAAGLHCRYMRYMKRAIVNETVETYADEYPDGWLDLEACEGRIGKGGHCEVAKCF